VVVVVAGDLWEIYVLEALKSTFDLDLEGDFLRSGLAKDGKATATSSARGFFRIASELLPKLLEARKSHITPPKWPRSTQRRYSMMVQQKRKVKMLVCQLSWVR
jgi:hypothetical protein